MLKEDLISSSLHTIGESEYTKHNGFKKDVLQVYSDGVVLNSEMKLVPRDKVYHIFGTIDPAFEGTPKIMFIRDDVDCIDYEIFFNPYWFEYDIKKEYFNWLSDLVKVDDDHNLLLKSLWKKEFYAIYPHDENRGEDGKQLRSEFIANSIFFDSYGYLDGPCNLLELLIGISRRMDDIYQDAEVYVDYTKDIFWELVRNLGLDELDDSCFIDEYGNEKINKVCDIFLSRKYAKDGKGGIFPVHDSQEKDMRKVELWYQMHMYIKEKKSENPCHFKIKSDTKCQKSDTGLF